MRFLSFALIHIFIYILYISDRFCEIKTSFGDASKTPALNVVTISGSKNPLPYTCVASSLSPLSLRFLADKNAPSAEFTVKGDFNEFQNREECSNRQLRFGNASVSQPGAKSALDKLCARI